MTEVYVLIAYKEFKEGVDQVVKQKRTDIYPSRGEIKKFAMESKADYVKIETRYYKVKEGI